MKREFEAVLVVTIAILATAVLGFFTGWFVIWLNL